MLPDLRTLLAVFAAAVALMVGAFGTAAKLRLARDMQSTPLQASRETLLTDAALQTAFGNPANLAPDVSLLSPPLVRVAVPSAQSPPAPPAPTAPVAIAPPATTPPAAAPPQTASLPAAATAPVDTPEVTGSIEAAHVDAVTPAASAPSGEPPVGGPLLEPSALAPGPELKPIVVPRRPYTPVRRVYGVRELRAREAARRIAAEQAKRARTEQQQPFTFFNNDVRQ